MSRKLWITAAVVFAAFALAGIAYASSSDITKPVTLHIIDKGQHDVLTDIGPAGASEGDLFTFSDQIVTPSNHNHVIGRIDGECVLMIPAQSRFECHLTHTLFGRGTVTSEGVFVDAPGRVNDFAVNGGTGRFRNARGNVTFFAIPIGQDETLHLIP
jgi:hypothetical protein